MTTVAAPLVEIHTCPQDVPSVPPWFAELILLARQFTQRGVLDALSEHVRLARGRAGHYEVIDFVALLLAYAVSGEPTLEAVFDLCWLPHASGRIPPRHRVVWCGFITKDTRARNGYDSRRFFAIADDGAGTTSGSANKEHEYYANQRLTE